MYLQVGSRYEGRFQILALLRTEQFSALYSATDALDRAVWLKVLTFDQQDHYSPQLKARYERELRLLAPLRDPHTVRLLQYGEGAAGELYLVYETPRGTPLSQLLAGRTIDPKQAEQVVAQILSSLREAHHVGVIHRNLTPDNIYIDERSEELHVTVIDFGVARGVGADHPSVTATGDLTGSPRYMSPEQLLREPVGPPSDLYSVGLIGFEMLFGGAVLGDGSFGSAFERMQRPTIASARGAFGELLEQLCQREPSARYPHAGAALEDLNRRSRLQFTGTLAGVTPPQSPRPPVAQPTERSRATWVAVAAGAAVAVILLAVLFRVTRSEPVAPAPPRVVNVVRNVDTLTKAAAQEEPRRVVAEKVELTEPERPDVASPGCSNDRPPRIRTDRYIPESYDGVTPMPLVLLLNTDYLEPSELLRNSGFIPLADKHGWIVAALGDDTSMTGVFVPLSKQWRTAESYDTLRRRARDFQESACIDTSRVFIVAHGTGGIAGDELSCEPWVTAFVSNGYATLDTQMPRMCDRPVPRLILYPEDSPHVGRDGTPRCGLPEDTVVTVDETTAYWRRRNSCEEAATTTKVGDARCHTWRCGLPFSLCEVPGGTLWPPGHQEFFGHQSFMGCPKDSEPEIDVAAQVEKFLLTVAPRVPVDNE